MTPAGTPVDPRFVAVFGAAAAAFGALFGAGQVIALAQGRPYALTRVAVGAAFLLVGWKGWRALRAGLRETGPVRRPARRHR